MSYDITIGELEYNKKDGHFVKSVRHENAPADGVPTDYTNQRWPAYSAWEQFENETNIHGLIDKHPGYVPITLEMVLHCERQCKMYKGVTSMLPKTQQGRLNWLAYWMRWAFENCKTPVVYNS